LILNIPVRAIFFGIIAGKRHGFQSELLRCCHYCRGFRNSDNGNAESYLNLLKQGYSAGKLVPGKSGNLGWVLSNGDQKFFCCLNAGVAYAGKKEMVGFTTSGRMIKLDRAVFEASIGGLDPSIP